MTTATSLTTPQKFSISKLLEEARLGDRRLSSPILARCNRSSLKWLPVESTLPASPLTCTTDIRLYCKNQLFLQISDDGSVSGTRDQLCPYGQYTFYKEYYMESAYGACSIKNERMSAGNESFVPKGKKQMTGTDPNHVDHFSLSSDAFNARVLKNNMTTATSLTTPQKFSISKLLEEARLGDRRLSSPILARCNRSSLKWLPVESTLPASPLTCTTDIRLYCKNQLFLQISDDGSVSGTRDQLCPYGQYTFYKEYYMETTLEIHTLSKNTVRIYSPKVKKYLAIDSNGRLCSKGKASEDTVLHHTHELNDFHTFASQKYYKDSAHDMFVALQRDGQPRKATTTYRLHKASQFLIV
ncbi:predicted protein [Nematostella vectensis]|uniref:Fibroblast growth factor n=1 Tax=Nematostella vectensis TaxID=45351 RepID=A7SFH7_NEMVE|nr:predicted protein [Nematostella vectensis]|eukprot:XP_001629624.1 predicted protein [Nematostella vectensis]